MDIYEGKCYMGNGYVRTSHLVYIIIIAIIVLSFFLVISFGGTESASTKIGTASTVSSLILSVIAIVLSLIDVAGQRQSMVDLKETADKLHETNERAITLNQVVMEKMDQFQLMKDEMIALVAESSEWKQEVIEKIESVKEKGDYKTEDFEKILYDLNSRENLLFASHIKPMRTTPNIRPTTYLVLNYLKNNYKNGESIPHEEYYDILRRKYKLNNLTIDNVTRELKEKGSILLHASTVEFTF